MMGKILDKYQSAIQLGLIRPPAEDRPGEFEKTSQGKGGQTMHSLMRCFLITVLLVSLLPRVAAKAAQTQAKTDRITLEVMNPMGAIEPPKTLGISPRVPDLAGKRIALMHNNKPGATNMLDALQKLLSKKYPTAQFIRGYETDPVMPPKDPDLYKKAAAACDTFIFAMGD
jgi:hypothetical protein